MHWFCTLLLSYTLTQGGVRMSETIGDRIRLIRQAQHLSQKALAWRVGITAPALSQIETGHVEPRTFTLTCLADALGVSMDYLAGRTDTPIP